LKIDALGDWRRTHYSVEVTPDLDGEEVLVFGWVLDIRDLGSIRFIILRDREGDVQVTFLRKMASVELVRRVDAIQRQYSLGVKGIVRKTEMARRGVEIIPKEVKVVGVAESQLPLDVTGRTPADIDVRLNAS
jgi:nondiscriminating aspartyl-tRNA synthetase